MTNYNDGNWHGWNGGECTVYPKSKVEVVVRDPDGLIRLEAGYAQLLRWEYLECHSNIIAFRVVKEHREPREWWLCGGAIYMYDPGENFPGAIHVREVLE